MGLQLGYVLESMLCKAGGRVRPVIDCWYACTPISLLTMALTATNRIMVKSLYAGLAAAEGSKTCPFQPTGVVSSGSVSSRATPRGPTDSWRGCPKGVANHLKGVANPRCPRRILNLVEALVVCGAPDCSGLWRRARPSLRSRAARSHREGEGLFTKTKNGDGFG